MKSLNNLPYLGNGRKATSLRPQKEIKTDVDGEKGLTDGEVREIEEMFDTTDCACDAFFILPDGEFLTFCNLDDVEYAEHEQIGRFFGGAPSMESRDVAVSRGCVRVVGEGQYPLMEIGREPTPAQYKGIERFIEQVTDDMVQSDDNFTASEFSLELWKGLANRRNPFYERYSKDRMDRVVSDIRRYYAGGDMYRSSLMAFHEGSDEDRMLAGTGWTVGTATDRIRGMVEKRIVEISGDIGEEIDVTDVRLHGSRVRGDNRDDSDIDVVVEYSGDVSEDDLFNMLNEVPLKFEGLTIDVNPICSGKSGSMDEYMKRSRGYDAKKMAGKNAATAVTAAMDDRYMAFAKAGNKNACMKMVVDAASKAMPDTVLKDSHGRPKVMFHGTSQNFHYFDGGFNGITWVTDSMEYADCYADPERHCFDGDCNDGIILRLFANVKKVADIGDINEDWSEDGLRRIAKAIGCTYEELRKETRGYDYSYLYEINEVVGIIARRNGFEALFAMEGDGTGQTGTGFHGKAFTVGVLRPELLKLADAITYDDGGNIVPLSKRFDFMTRDIREGEEDDGTSPEDVEYAQLVRDGKTSKAEQMVADRVAKAFDQTKVVGEDGRPKVVYHGTSAYGFRSFLGDHGFWVTEDGKYAEEFHSTGGFKRPGSYRLYADIRNPVFLGNLNDRLTRDAVDEWAVEIGVDRDELSDVLDSIGSAYNDANVTKYEVTSSGEFVKWLDDMGFDGIKAIEGTDRKTVTWCAFYPSQLKSAGITYDRNGKLVPLSRRFNSDANDINEDANDGSDVPRETKNIAPNGKPSNLPDDLYRVVRTANFKRWFGDWENDPENSSKVLDQNGEPLVVWRGQGSEHDEIKSTSYFTENRSFARRFGSASAYFLNLRHPFVVDACFDPWDAIYEGRFGDGEIEKMGFNVDYPYETEDGDVDEERAAVGVDAIVSNVFYNHSDEYDGVIVYDCEDEDMISNQYVNFESNQVKAIANSGSFGAADNVFEDETSDARAMVKGDAEKMLAKVGGKTALSNGAKHGVKVAQRYAAKKAGAKTAMAAGAKAATRSVGKSLGKAAPFVGLGLGTKFAYDRAKQGDWLGATGELASGVASCFAGPGTATALGIDAALLARDAYKMKKSADADRRLIEQNDKLLSNTNFVRWFGNSKVVDDNDMPLAVFHGSNRGGGFSSFDLGKFNKCIYFTSSDDVAKEYSLGNDKAFYKCYLRIENPYVIDAGGSKWSNMKFDERKDVMKYCNDNESENFGHTRWITPDHVVAYVKANRPDCDGVIIKDVVDSAFSKGKPSTDYIVFDPKQVKSAENNGAYSADTANIYEDESDGGFVVDAWHGTRHAGFSQFDKDKIRFDGNGFFFTDAEEVARSYSGNGRRSGVYRVRLTMRHPLIVDANGEWWGDLSRASVYQEDGSSKTRWTVGQLFGFANSYTDRLARYVRTKTKFDGIVIRNVMDWGTNSLQTSKYPCTDYIVFEPDQIEIVSEED